MILAQIGVGEQNRRKLAQRLAFSSARRALTSRRSSRIRRKARAPFAKLDAHPAVLGAQPRELVIALADDIGETPRDLRLLASRLDDLARIAAMRSAADVRHHVNVAENARLHARREARMADQRPIGAGNEPIVDGGLPIGEKRIIAAQRLGLADRASYFVSRCFCTARATTFSSCIFSTKRPWI